MRITCKDFFTGSRQYSVEVDKKRFEITDLNTQDTRIIDDSFLKQTEYYESMNKYGCYPCRYTLTENKITLFYHVKDTAFLPSGYTTILFEYDWTLNELRCLSVLYPYECEGTLICYNLKDAE